MIKQITGGMLVQEIDTNLLKVGQFPQKHHLVNQKKN